VPIELINGALRIRDGYGFIHDEATPTTGHAEHRMEAFMKQAFGFYFAFVLDAGEAERNGIHFLIRWAGDLYLFQALTHACLFHRYEAQLIITRKPAIAMDGPCQTEEMLFARWPSPEELLLSVLAVVADLEKLFRFQAYLVRRKIAFEAVSAWVGLSPLKIRFCGGKPWLTLYDYDQMEIEDYRYPGWLGDVGVRSLAKAGKELRRFLREDARRMRRLSEPAISDDGLYSELELL
jgi:hypothetical protein